MPDEKKTFNERQELQGIISGLSEKLTAIQESTARERLLLDDRFRQETAALLRSLDQAINGYPAQSFLMLEEIRNTLKDHRKHYDDKIEGLEKAIEESCDEIKTISKRQIPVLAAKEDMIPRWAKIALTYLVGGIGIISAAVFTAWWYLSELSANLPLLLELIKTCKP